MSDPNLNELQSKYIKLDKSDEASQSEKTNQTSLNILTSFKKTNQNSIFVVPSQPQQGTTNQTNNLTTVTLINDSGSTSTKQQSPSTLLNKVTLIPLNLNANNLKQPTTTPIKIVNDVKTSPTQPKTTIISSLSNTKKLIQINSTPSTGFSTLQSSPNKSNNLITNLERSPQSKIFTISTQNTNLNSNNINNNNNNNSNNVNVNFLNSNNSSNTGNKIQYVKIVNTPQTSSNTAPNTTAIKITTISSNNSANNSNNGNTNNLQDNSGTRLSTILSTITPTTIKTLQKPTNNTKNVITNSNKNQKEGNSDTSVLLDAINSTNDNLNQSQNKTTTIQLVNSIGSNQSHIQTRNTNANPTPVIQRIQTIQNNNQPITKTIVSASTSINAQQANQSIDRTNNYKVLTQQLPFSNNNQIINAQNQKLKSVKPLSTSPNLNSTPNNPIVITKTINSGNLTEDNNKKQVITTTIKSDLNSKQTIVNATTPITLTQIANSSNLNNTNNSVQIRTTNSNENDKNQIKQNLSMKTNSNLQVQQTSPISSNLNSLNQQTNQTISQTTNNNSSSNANLSSGTRKPCNCTKSMCLKLYCDCFAIGSFCHDCNCINCFNTLEHEDERNKAIKMVLDRNPQAFQSKIGKFTASIALSKVIPPPSTSTSSNGIEDLITASTASEELDEIQSRHVKGCNCKKSNCLKRYCECYLAKIQCSALCKCVGCKNCDESTRTLLQLANAADLRKQQQQQQQQQLNQQLNYKQQFQPNLKSSSTFFSAYSSNKHNIFNSPSNFKWGNSDLSEFLTDQEQLQLEQQKNINRSYASVLNESIESACMRLIEQISDHLDELNENKIETDKDEDEEEEEENKNDTTEYDELLEKVLIEEFGKCLSEIIDSAEKRNIVSN